MATIDDIARKLGISASTVSRALSGSRLISAEVRGRVRQLAKQMDYDKRRSRRHRGRAILNIKLVLPRHTDPERALFYDFASLIEGLRRGFDLCAMNLLCEVNGPEFAPYPHKKGGDIDAFVFAFHRPTAAVIKQLADHATPYVVLNRAIKGMPCIAVDHDAGMLELLDHLLKPRRDLRPRFISLDGLEKIHEERLESFAKACRTRGVVFDPAADCVSFENIGSIQSKALANAVKGANALICVNDIVGTVVLTELDRLGLSVPGKIAVTGFDDSPVRRLSRPLLTTVSLPVEQLALHAAKRLQAEVIENKTPDALLRIKGTLIPGDSTP